MIPGSWPGNICKNMWNQWKVCVIQQHEKSWEIRMWLFFLLTTRNKNNFKLSSTSQTNNNQTTSNNNQLSSQIVHNQTIIKTNKSSNNQSSILQRSNQNRLLPRVPMWSWCPPVTKRSPGCGVWRTTWTACIPRSALMSTELLLF